MSKIIRKNSKIDSSVNWIIPYNKSYLECRYVRRSEHYISAYVSSHNGCKMGCKFCWLTVTQQNSFNHTSLDQYRTQINQILSHSKKIDKDQSKNIRINVNFMARGEPLSNKTIVNYYPNLHHSMEKLIVNDFDYKEMKINISTILPTVVKNRELVDIFGDKKINIYYSLYSLQDSFREKWLPNAMSWELALKKLRRYQNTTGNPITFHFAIIKNENDNLNDISQMAKVIKDMNFNKTKFNLVRFNPHPDTPYIEPSEEHLKKIHHIIQSACQDGDIKTNKSRIVPRVGNDIWVSCGMFPSESDL